MSKTPKRLSDEKANFLGLELKKHQKGRNQAKYFLSKEELERLKEFKESKILEVAKVVVESKTVPNDYIDDKPFVLSAWNSEKGEMLSLEEFCLKYKIDFKKVTSAKFLPYHYAQPTYHVVTSEYKKEGSDFDDLEEYAIKAINKHIDKKVKPIKFFPSFTEKDNYLFDVAVLTDVHVAMNPNPNGYSLYGGKWDEKELELRRKLFVNRILVTKKSKKLVIFDLGDFMDGWDGETVRKGHELPQNMDNEKAFDVGVDFKISLIDELYLHFEEIDFISICDDNHSGSFAYVVNSSFKRFVEIRYANVKVINQRKFIDHYIYENKVFVATHGKDGKNLKFGFKPILDPKQIEKIDNYLIENDLIRKGLQVIFIKGDSHQDLLDNSTAQNFYYWNMPAFSPSSNWVQTNFKKGISGFYTFNFEKDCHSTNPYYFKWK
ncbi:hypothetical protein Phi10:1_gp006 [Cellulophaga phage phi10:1]|uniref:Uncharacterized protein n=1 Tax=Cellulophaga phage phi10:1 TaxID=1327981 RepID=S0A1I1_9CAUD|nr:hypothetical protein Phi10:1_gp006 [Cellulophaga phage phi10:1]AGO48347.1 hypothetical protein Phi10:1_gp006 [Cellulophaga phage phi10:1]